MVPKRGYHHGDLPRSLIEHALRLLDSEGLAALSVSAAARGAGVTHAAVYRHFGDRQALLEAVAGHCFADLTAAMSGADRATDSHERRMLNVGWSIVRFALRWPERYQLMFGGTLSDTADELAAPPPDSPFADLVKRVEQWQLCGLFRKGDPVPIAMSLWATTHGLASLLASGRLRTGSERSARALADRIHGNLLEGLRDRG